MLPVADEEFLLLNDLNKSKNLELPYDKHDKFDLDNLVRTIVEQNFHLKSKISLVWQKSFSYHLY